MASPSTLKMRIEGMDCGACAVKIENAMKRIPAGVSEINVSYGQESLSLTFDEDRTSPTSIADKIKALGFMPVSDAQRVSSSSTAGSVKLTMQSWWRTRKGQRVLFTGVMFAIAFTVAQIVPRSGRWAFSVAALVNIVPVLRRAYSGATSGTPFSIETLMSVAPGVIVVVGVPRRKATVRRCTCCIRDEGRPLGFADQAVIPNHPELHSLRAGVVSV